jgi:hypothetical protein
VEELCPSEGSAQLFCIAGAELIARFNCSTSASRPRCDRPAIAAGDNGRRGIAAERIGYEWQQAG